MTTYNLLNKGRITDILSALKTFHQIENISELSDDSKLNVLLTAIQLPVHTFDDLLANNPPVLRTIKGHTFEVVFKRILQLLGHTFTEVGGDSDIDLVVNGVTLQLKTPYLAGSSNEIVQFKTHKTHGAKSEEESMSYYHKAESFADYLVGLVSYTPFKVVLIARDELPRHSKSNEYILSPFKINWTTHLGLSDFNRIKVSNYVESDITHLLSYSQTELLPLTSEKLQLSTNIILDTILLESNFRIWDMNIRGFAREAAIRRIFFEKNISVYAPIDLDRVRADKSDFALKTADGQYDFFQVKGVSANYCKFQGEKSTLSIETQLTRGRINDHPTQSRLYLKTDFDFLILCLDPALTRLFDAEINRNDGIYWRFFCIPTHNLAVHPNFQHRIKAIQTFKLSELEKFECDEPFYSKYI